MHYAIVGIFKAYGEAEELPITDLLETAGIVGEQVEMNQQMWTRTGEPQMRRVSPPRIFESRATAGSRDYSARAVRSKTAMCAIFPATNQNMLASKSSVRTTSNRAARY